MAAGAIAQQALRLSAPRWIVLLPVRQKPHSYFLSFPARTGAAATVLVVSLTVSLGYRLPGAAAVSGSGVLGAAGFFATLSLLRGGACSRCWRLL